MIFLVLLFLSQPSKVVQNKSIFNFAGMPLFLFITDIFVRECFFVCFLAGI